MRGRRIVLGVTGGIAAYKTPELVRQLVKAGAEVRCLMTRAAAEFVTARALETVSGHRVLASVFDDSPAAGIDHIRLADEADLFLVAPCTAHTLARLALGLADDLVSTVALATRAPILVAPAMNVNMWEHATTQAHAEALRARGVRFVGPATGELACGWVGAGRMAEPADLVAAAMSVLGAGPLAGRRVLVTAGPTHEPVDPVRFLGNRSSGKMGYAIAEVARDLGAIVTLVSGPVALVAPAGVELVRIQMARELEAALEARWRDTDVLVMAAAVADFRPVEAADQKLDRRAGTPTLVLAANPDILAGIGRHRREEGRARPLLVGFAAETRGGEALVDRARQKLSDKGCDVVVANDVSGGAVFGEDESRIVVVTAEGADPIGPTDKRALARQLWQRLALRLA